MSVELLALASVALSLDENAAEARGVEEEEI